MGGGPVGECCQSRFVHLVSKPPGVARPAASEVTLSLVPSPASDEGVQASVLTPALVEVDEEIVEFEQYSIQIRRRDLPDPEDPFGVQVVSVLELLSPSNKGASGGRDRQKFLVKRQEHLASPVSYVEIDLLRAGERELPSSLEVLKDYPFIAWSSQVQQQLRHHWGWGWGENDPLPTIGVPLEYPRVHPKGMIPRYSCSSFSNSSAA